MLLKLNSTSKCWYATADDRTEAYSSSRESLMVPKLQFTRDGDVVHMHMLAKCGSNWADDPPSDEVGARALLVNLCSSNDFVR